LKPRIRTQNLSHAVNEPNEFNQPKPNTGIAMFQTMEGNARPHGLADVAAESEAELMRALQTASDSIMRLAGALRARPDGMHRNADVVSIMEQQATAERLIGRLLAM
jgi:hypothetical protein